jgi:hypothetical protein
MSPGVGVSMLFIVFILPLPPVVGEVVVVVAVVAEGFVEVECSRPCFC